MEFNNDLNSEFSKEDWRRANKLKEYCRKYPELNKLMREINESTFILQDLLSNIKSLEYTLKNEHIEDLHEEKELNKVIQRVIERYKYQGEEEFGKIMRARKDIQKTMKRLNLKY